MVLEGTTNASNPVIDWSSRFKREKSNRIAREYSDTVITAVDRKVKLVSYVCEPVSLQKMLLFSCPRIHADKREWDELLPVPL